MDWSTIVGVAYRLPSISATLSVTTLAHSILISKSKCYCRLRDNSAEIKLTNSLPAGVNS